jgi:rhamnose utilization protein RhaD (predicted bifunctional aldolase and dehydrogenase)
LVYATRLLGRDKSLGLYGGGAASSKLTTKDLTGEAEELLFVDHGLQTHSTIQADGFSILRCKSLARLAELRELPAALLENEIACSRTITTSPVPPVEALLHTVEY